MFNRAARNDPQQDPGYAGPGDGMTIEAEPDAAAAADADEWAGCAVSILRRLGDDTDPAIMAAQSARAHACATLAHAAEARATRMVLRDLYTLLNDGLFAEDGTGLTRVLDNMGGALVDALTEGA